MVNRKLLGGSVLLLLAILLLGGLLRERGQSADSGSTKLPIVASFYPLAFLAEEIGGDNVSVKTITPAGAEPHDYEPTAQDISSLTKAQLVILNGAGLEPWGQKVPSLLTGSLAQVVTVSEGLATRQATKESELTQDPHIWLDPVLVQKIVERLTMALVAADPAHLSDYQSRSAGLINRLNLLDNAYSQGLNSCFHRDFVTAHVAFGYLADRYKLKQVAIAGISPDEEPSAQTLVEISQLVKDKGISYIFFESLVSPKLAQTIAQETGAQTLELNPLEGLTPAEITAGQDYFSVMRANLQNLQTALSCK